MTVRLSLPGGAEPAPQSAPRLTRKELEAQKIANANRKVEEEDMDKCYETPRMKPKIVKFNEDGTIKEEDSDDIETDEDPAIAEASSSAKNRTYFYDIE